MIINIATTGRFHVLDLARELHDLGHDVRFYSFVSKSRCERFGLKREYCVSFLPILFPLLAVQRLFPKSLFIRDVVELLLDYMVGHFMRRCDVFIAMSGVYLDAFRQAKKRFGAFTIIERGSTHVNSFYEIMKSKPNPEPAKRLWHRMHGDREVEGYKICDIISIASDHVRESFISNGIPESKLWINPYAVDLDLFKPSILTSEHYDVIMVGTWSYCKGADRLAIACNELGLSLLHVGSPGDIVQKKTQNITHAGAVDQKELPMYYAQARVFALHSRQEGMALVQVQAMACGLPIVCSQHTGGRDLRKFIDDPKWIIETKDDSIEELKKSLMEAIRESNNQPLQKTRQYSACNKEFSWSSYGRRYNDNLLRIYHNE